MGRNHLQFDTELDLQVTEAKMMVPNHLVEVIREVLSLLTPQPAINNVKDPLHVSKMSISNTAQFPDRHRV